MRVSIFLWILLAFGIFWIVGVYNRLMRMRARGVDALNSLEKHLRQYAGLVNVHLVACGVEEEGRHSLPLEWMQLLETLDKMEQALKRSKRTPLEADSIAQIALALSELQEFWIGLEKVPIDLAGSTVPDLLHLQWEAVSQKVHNSMNGMNQILHKYNLAIEQFPANLVAGFFGFKPVRLL